MKQLFSLVIAFTCFHYAQGQNQSKIDSLNGIAIQDSSISTDSLLMLFKQNLREAQTISYEEGVAGSYWQISLIYAYRGDKEQSLDAHLKAIRSYEKAGNLEKTADGYGELGYKMRRDDLEKAQEYMLKGMRLAEQHDFRFVLSRTYNNYGVLKEMKQQLDSAESYYRKGLKIVLEDDYKIGIPYSYSNLAGVYGQQGKYDSARYYFREAQKIRLEIQDNKGVAENHTQIGEVFLEEKRPQMAIASFQKAVPLAQSEDYNFLVQYTYQKLSEAYKILKQTDSALFYLEKHNTLKDSLNNLEVQQKIAQLNIEFETEQKENEILKQQAQIAEDELRIKNRNFAIFGFSGLLILGGLLAYLVINRQKLEKRQLAQEKELEVALARLETQDKLEEQRLRISRDLHDNIGSQLTYVTSSLDNLKYRLKMDGNTTYFEKLDDIKAFTLLTINELRDTVWAMNKEYIELGDLQSRLADLVGSAAQMNPEVRYDLNVPSNGEQVRFSALEGINLYRIIQEALNNATKYSGSQRIEIKIERQVNSVVFSVTDFGKGFDTETVSRGNGLNNITKRAEDAGAKTEVTSTELGTKITIKKSLL